MELNDEEVIEEQSSNLAGVNNHILTNTLSRMLVYIKGQESRLAQLENERQEAIAYKLDDGVALRHFQKFHPPIFNGEDDEERAERWMERLMDIYAALGYEEERKLEFGVFQLEGTARTWWKLLEQEWDLKGTPRTWKNFQEAFKKKFIPLVVRERREEEFLTLQQGSMTVAQYEIKFTRLSKYAPEMVNTECKRKKRFLRGLKLELQHALVSARLDTYADVVEYAQRSEISLNQLNCLHEIRKSRKRRREKVRHWKSSKGSQPNYTPPQTTLVVQRPTMMDKTGVREISGPPVRCQYCGGSRHHMSECWRKAGKCLACGRWDHYIKDCPQKVKNSTEKAKISKRTYARNK